MLCALPGLLQGQTIRLEDRLEHHSGKAGFVDAVAVACPAVVSIQGEKQYEANELRQPLPGGDYSSGDNITHVGMGTGIIVDERGYIVTNYHVVKGLLKIQITTSDGTVYQDVEFIRNDLQTDLALIRIKPTAPLATIKFGRSCDVDLAEDVIAIGNPFGYQVSVSKGIVSGLNRPLKASETLSYDNVIQTDAAINPGNSGGPLINIKGEMIGLNAAVREGAENIAFAIPVDTVVEVTERMIRQSVARMTHHGLTFRENGRHEDGKSETLVVASVRPNSPASSAGIRSGDVLVNSNHRPTTSPLDFTRSLIDVKLFDSVPVTVARQGKDVAVKLDFGGSSKPGQEEAYTAQVGRPVTSRQPFEEAAGSPAYGFANASGSAAGSVVAQNVGSTRTADGAANGTVDDLVRRRFGIEIEPVSSAEFHKRYPRLAVVSIGQSKIYPSGGVSVLSIDEHSVFRTQKDKIEPGDFIFGIVIGDKPENRWSTTSVNDLYFIAQKLDEMKTGQRPLPEARIYLIRDNTPYFLDMTF